MPAPQNFLIMSRFGRLFLSPEAQAHCYATHDLSEGLKAEGGSDDGFAPCSCTTGVPRAPPTALQTQEDGGAEEDSPEPHLPRL